MVVRGRSLVQQASKRLHEMEVPHAVFMGNEYDARYPVQIVSIDTVRSRQQYPPAKMLIIDECHHAVSSSFKDFLEHYEDSFILGVSATPYPKEGLEHVARKVIYPISITELFEQKYLCPPKYFAPNKLDMAGVKKTAGEYNEKESFNAFEKAAIYGHVASHWQKLCKGESSLCFAITLKHGLELVKTFYEVGARAVLITAKDSLSLRSEAISALESGNIDVIVNVGTMTTGVDIPSLKNIIMCRPTMSKILFTQMLGRGTRTAPGKEYFKVIDHVGNIERHGFIEDERQADLKPAVKRKGPSVAPVKTCPDCYAVMAAGFLSCAECGYKFESKKKELGFIDTELKEILFEKDEFKRFAIKFAETAVDRGYSIGYVWIKLKEKFGEEECRKRYQVYRVIKDAAKLRQYSGTSKDSS